MIALKVKSSAYLTVVQIAVILFTLQICDCQDNYDYSCKFSKAKVYNFQMNNTFFTIFLKHLLITLKVRSRNRQNSEIKQNFFH